MGSDEREPGLRRWSLLGAVAFAMAWAYLSAIFLLDRGVYGTVWWFAVAYVFGFVTDRLLRGAVKRHWITVGRIKNLVLLTSVALFCLIAADTLFAVHLNIARTSSPSADLRFMDRHVWVSELYPKLFYPTERNFRLLKPGVRVSGSHYGAFYTPSMLNSPTLTDSVLELNELTIAINDLGFRDSKSMTEAEVFVLSDSFGFGWGVDAEESWPRLLEASIARPVYNLSISDSSPLQELELLEYVLRTGGDSIRIKHVLWMIYEGNDLEDSYAERSPWVEARRTGDLIAGTTFGAIRGIPRAIRGQSIVHKLRTGQARPRAAGTPETGGIHEIDGVPLEHPLFRSSALGLRLFYGPYVERVQKTEEYVTGHPNRPRLERVFARMAALAERHGFRVTVLLVPTAARLHGPYFDEFPVLSERPYFLELVSRLSASNGFDTVNLYELMKPYAGRTLLYFRDDDHLNRRGHEVVAQLVRESVFSPPP